MFHPPSEVDDQGAKQRLSEEDGPTRALTINDWDSLCMAGSLVCRTSLGGSYHQIHLTGNWGGGFFAPNLTATHGGLSWPWTSSLLPTAEDWRHFISVVLLHSLWTQRVLIKTDLLFFSSLSASEVGYHPSLQLAIASSEQEATLVHFLCLTPHHLLGWSF